MYFKIINNIKNKIMAKVIAMTGSPKPFFKTKKDFIEQLSEFGFIEGKMKKKNNEVDILVTNEPNSTTNKMKLADELGVEIMTYEEIAEAFDLETL